MLRTVHGERHPRPFQQPRHPHPQVIGQPAQIDGRDVQFGRFVPQPAAQLHPPHQAQHPADALVHRRQISLAFRVPGTPLQHLACRRHLRQLDAQLRRLSGCALLPFLLLHHLRLLASIRPMPYILCYADSPPPLLGKTSAGPLCRSVSNFVEFSPLYQKGTGKARSLPRAPSGKYPLTPLGKGDKMTRDKAMTGRSTPTPHPQREAGRCEALVRQEGRRP